MDGIVRVPAPTNEPVRQYAPGSPETAALQREIERLSGEVREIPLRIGGQAVRTGVLGRAVCPHDHRHVLAHYHQAGAAEAAAAVQAAGAARAEWAAMPWPARLAVFLKAADLLAGRYRDTLNAAAILALSKTPFQAEIDAACELTDFLRFNAAYVTRLFAEQPEANAPGTWNRLDYRPLDGFVFAVTPFNFVSIAGNLPTAPAMLGNTVVWKPASSAVLPAAVFLELLEAAGLPPGVINFVPGPGGAVGDPVLAEPELAGVHFTGSTAVFQRMWATVGANIARYRNYPRLVGETGGKDFVVAHPSADPDALRVALVRGAFEYQGQKCSAASRAYIPQSLWRRIEDALVADIRALPMGDPTDFRHFMGAVIDRGAFESHRGYIEHAKAAPDCRILAGGRCDDGQGYFIAPTLVLTDNPRQRLMVEEIFGPVLTVFVYPDERYAEALQLCDAGSPYGLTGAIFARDRQAILQAEAALRHAAGNFYINDKPTGAVVGQQPFGGGRASGTNDKAGSVLNLVRWTSPRVIKETFSPPHDWRYPHMQGA